MIVTLTVNPSFDRTLQVPALVRGDVARAQHSLVEPAGKGINVAVATGVNGGAARAVFPAGPDDADRFERALAHAGVDAVPVLVQGSVRTNITVVEDDGTTTKINERGTGLRPDELDSLIETLVRSDAGDGWVVASGSLPPGVPPDFYRRVSEAVPDAGRRLAIDTSGRPLIAAIGAECAVLKPNLEELESIVGSKLSDLGSVIDAADSLLVHGPGSVLVSLGSRGAVLVSARGASYGTASVPAVLNTVGAGDALLAGFLAAGGQDAVALSEALAWGRVAVRCTSTIGPPVADTDRKAVVLPAEIPRDCMLKEFV